jgi:hypothetical protein
MISALIRQSKALLEQSTRCLVFALIAANGGPLRDPADFNEDALAIADEA